MFFLYLLDAACTASAPATASPAENGVSIAGSFPIISTVSSEGNGSDTHANNSFKALLSTKVFESKKQSTIAMI
jgi:hypothetical protein